MNFKEDVKQMNRQGEELWSSIKNKPLRKVVLFVDKMYNPIKWGALKFIKAFYYVISFGKVKL